MEENTFSALSGDADISAYQDIDLTQLNLEKPIEVLTENKLSGVLIRVIFVAKALTWISLFAIACMALYSWSRQQTQDSWLMNQGFSAKETISCKWMNREKDKNLRRDSTFFEYLKTQNKTALLDLENSSRCMALETIAEWLSLENTFAILELSKQYAEIIPKKFLGNTLEGSQELSVIAQNSPVNRMHHDEVLEIVSETIGKVSEGTNIISCNEIRFHDVSASMDCTAETRFPLQSRNLALSYIQELEKNETILVTYPNILAMTVDSASDRLTTSFEVQITYLSARYEADQLKKLNYDKR